MHKHMPRIVHAETRQKLIAARNEQGDTRAESAGAQLTGDGEAGVKAVQPHSLLWNSILSFA